jgi:oligopeptide transport system permease protein
LGKDSLGRDIFNRVLQGAQVSILLGLGSSLGALVIGIGYGAFSALSRKWVDTLLMRVCDVFLSLPHVMLMAILALIFQVTWPDHNLLALFAVLTVGSWMPFARLARNLILKEKSQGYVEAARTIGAGPWRVFFHHITPNLSSALLVSWSLHVPHAILAEGLLSFLGFGVKSPSVSWGALMQEGWRTLASYPHLLLGPALFLFLTVLSLNILLENFRRSLDPHLKWEQYS